MLHRDQLIPPLLLGYERFEENKMREQEGKMKGRWLNKINTSLHVELIMICNNVLNIILSKLFYGNTNILIKPWVQEVRMLISTTPSSRYKNWYSKSLITYKYHIYLNQIYDMKCSTQKACKSGLILNVSFLNWHFIRRIN